MKRRWQRWAVEYVSELLNSVILGLFVCLATVAYVADEIIAWINTIGERDRPMTEPELRLEQGRIKLEYLRRKRDRSRELLAANAASIEDFEEDDFNYQTQVLEVQYLEQQIKGKL
jgi:hypothetical protein